MIKNLLEDKNKLNDHIISTNIISKILASNKSKKYSKNQIKNLKKSLDRGCPDDIIKVIFEMKINIKDIIPTNYKQIQTLYLQNRLNLSIIKQLFEYKKLKGDIEHFILKNKSAVISLLEMTYKNSSSQKGSMINQYFEELLKDKRVYNHRAMNGIHFLSNQESRFAIERGDNDFFYVPTKDVDLNNLMKNIGKPLKGKKGRDFFAKYKGYYFIGEAKEINEEGSAQSYNYNDLLSCLNETDLDKKIIGFGIIYGACCLYKNKYQSIADENEQIVTLSELTFNTKDVFNRIIEKLN